MTVSEKPLSNLTYASRDLVEVVAPPDLISHYGATVAGKNPTTFPKTQINK